MSKKPSKAELMEQLKSVALQMQEHRKKFPKAYADAQPTPPSMTLESALKAANPVFEISERVRGPYESMTEPEQIFWKANAFMGDTFNGGFIQTMENGTGDNFPDVEAFVNEYCAEPMRQIFRDLKQMFPGGSVPADYDERQEAIEKIKISKGDEPFDELDGRLYALEKDFKEGLLALAKKHRASFRGLK